MSNVQYNRLVVILRYYLMADNQAKFDKLFKDLRKDLDKKSKDIVNAMGDGIRRELENRAYSLALKLRKMPNDKLDELMKKYNIDEINFDISKTEPYHETEGGVDLKSKLIIRIGSKSNDLRKIEILTKDKIFANTLLKISTKRGLLEMMGE